VRIGKFKKEAAPLTSPTVSQRIRASGSGGIEVQIGDLKLVALDIPDSEIRAVFDTVIGRIPEEYGPSFPTFAVAPGFSKMGAYVDTPSSTLIIDAEKIGQQSQQVALGTIAHELAHVFLGRAPEPRLEEEYEADDLARQWGFAEEVDERRRLVGPPSL